MLTLLLVGLFGTTLPGAELQTLDGRSVTGPIVALTSERIVVQSASGRQTLKTSGLAGLSFAAPAADSPPPKVSVELVDGSTLAADDYRVDSGRATISLAGGPHSLELATAEIAAVRFAPHSAAIAAEWARVLKRSAASDRLVVHKGDAIDEHQGVLRDVTAAVVRFEVDGEVLPVKRERVSGMLYYHAAGEKLAEVVCNISDVDGSRWAVQAMSLADGKLNWSTPTGLKLSRPLAELKRIDFVGGKVVYLSDLKPESVAWSPYFRLDDDLPILNQFYAPRRDRTLESMPLALGGKIYRKGLAVYGRTEMLYRLPDRFRRFQAVVGIDDRVRPLGSMRLSIRGDNRLLWEATVTGAGVPQPLDLDVGGVRRLSIVADFSGAFDVGDHLLLCEAKVIK